MSNRKRSLVSLAPLEILSLHSYPYFFTECVPLQYAASSDWEYVSEGNSRWKHRTSNLEIQAETVIKCRIIRAIDKGSSLVWLCCGLLSSKSWDRLRIARWVPNKILLFALLLLLILLSVVFLSNTQLISVHTRQEIAL